MEDEKIVIIGGGVIGCATAYMIKRLSPGSRVLVLERSNGVAQDTSYQNGGVFTYGHCQAWNGRSIMWNYLKSLNNPFAYYKINHSLFFSFDFWLWTLRFIISSFTGLPERSHQVYTLGKRTTELHISLRTELINQHKEVFEEYLGTDIGLLYLYSKLPEFQKAKGKALSDNFNYNETMHVSVSRSGCIKYDLGMKDWKQAIVGCIKNHTELFCGHDSHKFAENLARVSQKLGAVFEYNAEVESFTKTGNKITSVKLTDGRVIIGDKFVLCSGVGSRNLGRMLGWVPPIWPGKGYTFNLKSSKKFTHTVYTPDDFPVYVVPFKGFNRVSGMCEFTTLEDKMPNQERVKFLIDLTKEKFSLADAEISDVWACQRPISVDDLPIIGKFPGIENAYINSGHGSKGCIFSLGSAELITHVLMNASPIIDPKPFSPDRFYF